MKNTEDNPIYVIGFPKSGNTWLARLLADITKSNMAVFSNDDVVNAAGNSNNRKDGRLIYKLHDVGNTNNLQSDKVVYIVRDIRDVLVSAFFFSNKFVNQKSVRLENKSLSTKLWKVYFKSQIRRVNNNWGGGWLEILMNFIRGNKKNIGNWSYHVNYWAKQNRVVIVRYEDLLVDTENELKKILYSLSLDICDESIRTAVFNQSFKKKKEDFQNAGDKINSNFLRNGKVGDWKNYFEPSLAEEIEKKHAVVMRRFGYELGYFGK